MIYDRFYLLFRKIVLACTIPGLVLIAGNVEMPAYESPSYSRNGEFLIDTAVINITAPAYASSIASNGTGYFVVWADVRSGEWNIYGTRVSFEGDVLDSAGIIISNAANSQGFPAICSDGSNYLIIWQDDRNGATDLYGARVTPQGIVLDPQGIVISDAYEGQYNPKSAFDGTNYLIVWKDRRAGSVDYDIYGSRVSPAGVVLDTAGIAISTASGSQDSPSIAYDGVNYCVVWQDYRNVNCDIYGARVSPGGIVLDSTGFAISTASNNQQSPSVAFDGSNYCVVWQDYRNGNWDVYGARVSPAGVVLDTAGIAISSVSGSQDSPSIAFDGINYCIAWQDNRRGNLDIYGARVSPGGIVLDSAGIAISTVSNNQQSPSITFGGPNYCIVWLDYRNTNWRSIYGSRVSRGGIVLDPAGIGIPLMPYNQEHSSVAFDGTNYLVVWQDTRNGGSYDIYGARVSPGGVVLDPTCIVISDETSNQIIPEITFDGTNYIVVWQDYRNGSSDIYGTRIDQSGTVLDPSGILIMSNAGSPKIASGDSCFLVVWRSGGDIYGIRVSHSGFVLDSTRILISGSWPDALVASVAYDTLNYLVVWTSFYYGAGAVFFQIYCARVSQTGYVLDPSGIGITSCMDYLYDSPTLAFDDYNYLVTWGKSDFDGNNSDIYGARVSPLGVVLDPAGIDIATESAHQSSQAITFGSGKHFVVWQDDRNGSWDIYGCYISRAGHIMDSFPVVLQSDNQVKPTIAYGTGDIFLIVYSGFTDTINGQPANTTRIWGKFYPFTGIEETASYPVSNASHTLKIYPNPFTAKTAIAYSILDGGYRAKNSSIRIYDVVGKLVRSFNLESSVMNYESNVLWDGRDDAGHSLSAGIYFVQFKAGNSKESIKVIKVD